MKALSIALGLVVTTSTFAQDTLLFVKKNNPSKNQIVEKLLTNKSTSKEDLEKIKAEMINSGEYKFVEFDTTEYEATDSNDSALALSGGWQHNAIDTSGAWPLIKNPSEVIVAVCDSGLESTHDDLQNVSVPGHSFVGDAFDTTPTTHHGTMVSGLISGQQNLEYKTSGIAPFVKIMPIRIANSSGSSSLSTIVECIKYGADHGAKVINVSFTGVNNYSIEEAGKYAADRGALLVYSAGNQGKYRDYPDHKNVLIVGGIEKSKYRWNCSTWYKKCGSNYGNFIDLVAPARGVLTTMAYNTLGGSKYDEVNGTSFSAPIVSAVAALIYSVNPYFTPSQVESILKETSETLGEEYVYGSGLVNAKKAVELALTR